MISAFMIYAIALSVIVGVAAVLLEKTFAALRLPRRGGWIVAMLLSVTMPIAMQASALRSVSLSEAPVQTFDVPHAVAGINEAPDPSQPVTVRIEQRRNFDWPALPSLDLALRMSWLFLSGGLLLFYVRTWLLLRDQRRAWVEQRVDGTNILVSDNIGPAVIGFWKSQIVVPQWLVSAHFSARALAIRHEAEHIAARDPLSLLLGLALMALMPWNAVLWWQLRRLRFAVEVDCDARVLRGGANAAEYGEALLLVGQRNKAIPLGAVALAEPPSDLERRIRMMMQGRSRFAALVAIGCVTTCASLLAATTQVDAPIGGNMGGNNAVVLPPPQPGFLPRVHGVLRAEFPELFDAPLSEPVLLNVLLNNDLTVDIAVKKTLALGTTSDAALPADAPNNGFSAEQLHPADPRWGGQLAQQDRPESQPLFVNFAVRGLSKTRSAKIVEPAIRAKFPQLYDAIPEGKVVVVALFDDDGTLTRAKHSTYAIDDVVDDRENRLKQLTAAGFPTQSIGTISVIDGSASAPYKPTILYAFDKSEDPSVEAHPLNPETHVEVAAQRALVERHFSNVATQSAQPHELLWMLLNTKGEVIRTGRTHSNPEELAASIDSIAPGTDVFVRRTKTVGELFEREVLDVQRQPVLVSFLWAAAESESPQTESAVDVLVASNIYRNGEIMSATPLSLKFGEQQAKEVANALRVEMSAINVDSTSVELRMRIQARARKKGIEYAEPWETASEPTIRIQYGEEGVVELGVEYPGNPDVAVWRLVLKPERATG